MQEGGAPDKQAISVQWQIDGDRHRLEVKMGEEPTSLGTVPLDSACVLSQTFEGEIWDVLEYTNAETGITYRLSVVGPLSVSEGFYYKVVVREVATGRTVDDCLTTTLPELTIHDRQTQILEST